MAGPLQDLKANLILSLTRSAAPDINDVTPSAVWQAGEQITRFGMSIDPVNFLFLGSLEDKAIIGLLGCKLSPALIDANWVFSRIAFGVASKI